MQTDTKNEIIDVVKNRCNEFLNLFHSLESDDFNIQAHLEKYETVLWSGTPVLAILKLKAWLFVLLIPFFTSLFINFSNIIFWIMAPIYLYWAFKNFQLLSTWQFYITSKKVLIYSAAPFGIRKVKTIYIKSISDTEFSRGMIENIYDAQSIILHLYGERSSSKEPSKNVIGPIYSAEEAYKILHSCLDKNS